MTSRFLTAEWRDLALLNYEVDPAVLSDLLPAGTELDSWNGRTLVSMVGFCFLNTRVLGIAIPHHRNFEEVNLRFYVRRRAVDGWRRGVVFVKELVPRSAIAWLARTVYGENYVALPMRHAVADDQAMGARTVSYEWRYDGRWSHLRVVAEGAPFVPSPDSEETFITEHYWGYAKQRNRPTVEYQVEHPKWLVRRAASSSFDCDVAALYGPRFQAFLVDPPSSAFVADGSAVTVRQGVSLDDAAG